MFTVKLFSLTECIEQLQRYIHYHSLISVNENSADSAVGIDHYNSNTFLLHHGLLPITTEWIKAAYRMRNLLNTSTNDQSGKRTPDTLILSPASALTTRPHACVKRDLLI